LSFEFCEGKWLQIQDSLDSTVADTVWFKEDSLIGWSSQGEPYEFLKGYFIDNYLFSQSRGSNINAPVDVEVFTTYSDSNDYLQIHWLKPGDPFYFVNYKKID